MTQNKSIAFSGLAIAIHFIGFLKFSSWGVAQLPSPATPSSPLSDSWRELLMWHHVCEMILHCSQWCYWCKWV